MNQKPDGGMSSRTRRKLGKAADLYLPDLRNDARGEVWKVLMQASTLFGIRAATIQNCADKRAPVVRARHWCFEEMTKRGVHTHQIAKAIGGCDRGTVYKALRSCADQTDDSGRKRSL